MTRPWSLGWWPPPEKPTINSWQDIDAALGRTGARYSYQVSKVNDGNCEKIAGTNTDESLPLASIFKTYVLFAVEDAVLAGTLRWNDTLTITSEAKKLGSSGFDKLPAGSQITVRQAAGKMISTSDNMATDLLIERLGTPAIEQALVRAGHHDPASMTPFPTMRELFSVGWGNPDVREQWKNATPADRAELLKRSQCAPLRTRSASHACAGLRLRRGVVRQRRRHLSRPCAVTAQRGRPGCAGSSHHV